MLKYALLILLAMTAPISAQQSKYVPPDEELWKQMAQAFAGLSMSLQAHQQIIQIMLDAEQAAQIREQNKQTAPPK